MTQGTNPGNARFHRATLPIFAALVSGLSGAAAQAQIVFEEIVVTAQKREQNLMDVPVAVSSISGQQIEEAGIKDVWDLQQNVPGLLMGRSQTTTSSNFNIRGIGSTSNNFGVESSVGLYVDGVYRSRQSSMINDLIDVEAVEVLRGPQGTLFGKNTAAGAVSIRTVAPSQDRDAFIDATFGDFGLAKVSAATNIPISDNVAFRGTVFATQRDGIASDISLGKDIYNDRDRIGTRLQLAINEPSDDFSVRIIADYAEIDEVCCIGTSRVDSVILKGGLPIFLAALQSQNPLQIQAALSQTAGSDIANASLGGTVFATYDYPDGVISTINSLLPLLSPLPGTILEGTDWGDYVTALNFPPSSTNEDRGISLEINKTLSDSVSLKSITALRAFDTFDSIDADFSDVSLIERINEADQSSISQEFQFIGEFGEGSSWVAGLYYFAQDLNNTQRTTAGTFFNDYAKAGNSSLQTAIDNLNAVDAGLELAMLGGLLDPATEPFPAGANSFNDVKQDHAGYAAFGQVDWAVNDKFTLSLGARFTSETKDIDAQYAQTANGPRPDLRPCAPVDPLNPFGDYAGGAVCVALTEAGIFLQSMGAAGSLDGVIAGDLAPISGDNVAWGMYLYPPFSPRPGVKDTLEDDQTTGTVKLTFFPTDSTMLYASYATGFKAGGTNSDRIDISFDQLFDAETSASMEAGLKGQYGPVQVVATLYKTDFDDFQANSFTGTGFNLQNAGDLEIKGWELELLWRPADRTEIQAWYAHNEGEFITFEAGTAWGAWVKQYGVWQGMGDPGCPGPVDPDNLPNSCARTGEAIPYNPEDRAFVAVTQEFDLSPNTTGFARLEYSHVSEQTTDGDNDPLTYSDGFEIMNARIGFNFDNINSSLTLWGRNITDERFYYGSFDVPVAEDKTLSYPSEPRTWGVTFHKNFD